MFRHKSFWIAQTCGVLLGMMVLYGIFKIIGEAADNASTNIRPTYMMIGSRNPNDVLQVIEFEACEKKELDEPVLGKGVSYTDTFNNEVIFTDGGKFMIIKLNNMNPGDKK